MKILSEFDQRWVGCWCAESLSKSLVIELRDGALLLSVFKGLAEYAYTIDRPATCAQDGALSVSLDTPDQGRAYVLRWEVPGERLVSAYEMPFEQAVSSGWDAIMLGLPDDHAWADPSTTYRRASDDEHQAISARLDAWRARRAT